MGLSEANAVFAPTKFGPYELLAKLAVGGMAEIYLAREHDGDDPTQVFVVKRLLPHIAAHPDLVQMFIDEVRVAATFDHENVVRVFNVGSIGDKYFQSMEYLAGVDLRQVCQIFWRNRKNVPRTIAMHVLTSVADGLAYVHSRTDGSGRPLNLIHRDISPHNIFVTKDGVGKVLDFGVAKAANAFHQTRTGALVGKLSYMSPEQARAQSLDNRSDLFSLGIVMWEMFAGRRLLRVKDLGEFEVLRRLSEDDMPPPSQFRKLPKRIDEIVGRALARSLEERYTDAAEIAADLREVAKSLGIDASQGAAREIIQATFAERLAAEGSNLERLVGMPPIQVPVEHAPAPAGPITGPQPSPQPATDEEFEESTNRVDKDNTSNSSMSLNTSASFRAQARRAPVRIPAPRSPTSIVTTQRRPPGRQNLKKGPSPLLIGGIAVPLVAAIGALLYKLIAG